MQVQVHATVEAPEPKSHIESQVPDEPLDPVEPIPIPGGPVVSEPTEYKENLVVP